MSRKYRKFSVEQKADVVRRHLRDKVSVSDLAEELQLQPSRIHQWVQQALARVELAFSGSPARPEVTTNDLKDQEIAKLKAKLVQKHEVISELMEENVKAKKANGDL